MITYLLVWPKSLWRKACTKCNLIYFQKAHLSPPLGALYFDKCNLFQTPVLVRVRRTSTVLSLTHCSIGLFYWTKHSSMSLYRTYHGSYWSGYSAVSMALADGKETDGRYLFCFTTDSCLLPFFLKLPHSLPYFLLLCFVSIKLNQINWFCFSCSSVRIRGLPPIIQCTQTLVSTFGCVCLVIQMVQYMHLTNRWQHKRLFS